MLSFTSPDEEVMRIRDTVQHSPSRCPANLEQSQAGATISRGLMPGKGKWMSRWDYGWREWHLVGRNRKSIEERKATCVETEVGEAKEAN